MIYLHRYTADAVDVAICETERGAQAHEARGYVRCGREAFLSAWRLRDERQMDERPAPTVETAPLARAVGDAPKPPSGYVVYSSL